MFKIATMVVNKQVKFFKAYMLKHVNLEYLAN